MTKLPHPKSASTMVISAARQSPIGCSPKMPKEHSIRRTSFGKPMGEYNATTTHATKQHGKKHGACTSNAFLRTGCRTRVSVLSLQGVGKSVLQSSQRKCQAMVSFGNSDQIGVQVVDCTPQRDNSATYVPQRSSARRAKR
jgi:hypothetical protein